MSSDNILRFPTERTTRGKQDEALRAFYAARREWRQDDTCKSLSDNHIELLTSPPIPV